LFPYTTLFRSLRARGLAAPLEVRRRVRDVDDRIAGRLLIRGDVFERDEVPPSDARVIRERDSRREDHHSNTNRAPSDCASCSSSRSRRIAFPEKMLPSSRPWTRNVLEPMPPPPPTSETGGAAVVPVADGATPCPPPANEAERIA